MKIDASVHVLNRPVVNWRKTTEGKDIGAMMKTNVPAAS